MADLRAELNHCCSGEDGRTTIERQHEWCYNLDSNYDTPKAALARCATHSPSCLGAASGCMALAPHLQMVVWLLKFQPHLSEKYDGSVNHAKFLHIYTSSILAVGGNEVVMANYFPVALISTTRSWLMNLPAGSLYSWKELYHRFMASFESVYSRPCNVVDLHSM
jgi:hypothetical protein